MAMRQASSAAVAKRSTVRNVSRLLVAAVALIGVDLAVSVRPAHAGDPAWVAGGIIGTVGTLMVMDAMQKAQARAAAQARAQARANAKAAKIAKQRTKGAQTASNSKKAAKSSQVSAAALESAPMPKNGPVTASQQASAYAPVAPVAPPPSSFVVQPTAPAIAQSRPPKTTSSFDTEKQIELMAQPAY